MRPHLPHLLLSSADPDRALSFPTYRRGLAQEQHRDAKGRSRSASLHGGGHAGGEDQGRHRCALPSRPLSRRRAPATLWALTDEPICADWGGVAVFVWSIKHNYLGNDDLDWPRVADHLVALGKVDAKFAVGGKNGLRRQLTRHCRVQFGKLYGEDWRESL